MQISHTFTQLNYVESHFVYKLRCNFKWVANIYSSNVNSMVSCPASRNLINLIRSWTNLYLQLLTVTLFHEMPCLSTILGGKC